MTRRATGPVTAAGKAISAQNARRHGLSAEPAADLVRAWFNVVLDNPGDAYEEPDADTPRREVALRLAIAEARYRTRDCGGQGHFRAKRPQARTER